MRILLFIGLMVLAACDKKQPPTVTDAGSARPVSDAPLARFECNRCHVIDGTKPTTVNMDCRECHRQIIDGTYPDEPAEYLEMWDKGLENMRDVPSLRSIDERLTRRWFIEFVRKPHDLRPRLGAMMPRLNISLDEAEALANALGLVDSVEHIDGDEAAGRLVLDSRGCGTCHVMSGLREPLAASPIGVSIKPDRVERAMYLAPDLRHVRRRFRGDRLVLWLKDPAKLKPDALMPNMGLTDTEARDAAAFLMNTAMQKTPRIPTVTRLPVLQRQVRWKEVQAKLVDEICLHCHSDPKYNEGDGGPGNTGGFGYKGRKLDLSSFDRATSDPSFYAVGSDGAPKIVSHLMARHQEVATGRYGPTLGMPLGFPPIDLERIQLLETWIAQGLQE